MLTKLTFSNKKTINVGNYENENPMASITVEFENPEGDAAFCAQQFEEMVMSVNSLLKQQEERIKNPKKHLSHHRIDVIDGISYVHVTTAITPITPLIRDIEKHGEVGTLLDGICKHYIDNGVFVMPEVTLDEKWSKILIDCFNGIQDVFLTHKDDLDLHGHSMKVLSKEHRYVGELDAFGNYKESPALFDFKKTKDLSKSIVEKYFMQLAAYAKAQTIFDVESLVILSPFNKPLVTNEVEKYFEMFLKKRAEYKETYGV